MLGKPKGVSDDLTNPCLLWRLLSGFGEPGCSPAGGFGEVCEGEHWKDLGRQVEAGPEREIGGWERMGVGGETSPITHQNLDMCF